MKLSLFAICEGAFNHNGHLTIVNTLDFINVSSLPYKIPQLGLALKFIFTPEDEGTKNIKIVCNTPQDETFIEVESPVQVPQLQEEAVFCISSNLNGLLFPIAGNYIFNIMVDEQVVGTYGLHIKEKQS